jgi:hypothetical protein
MQSIIAASILRTSCPSRSEEVLQPVLGFINDAVQMIDSLITWRSGMTTAAHRSILEVLRIADDSIRIVVDELASWLAAEAQDE